VSLKQQAIKQKNGQRKTAYYTTEAQPKRLKDKTIHVNTVV
jgi:hypothetical protein